MGDCFWVNHDQQYETDCGGSICYNCSYIKDFLDTTPEGYVFYQNTAGYTGPWPNTLDTVNWGPVTIHWSELAGVVSMDGRKAIVRSWITPFCINDSTFYATFDIDDPQNTLTCMVGGFVIPPEFKCC